MLQLSSNVHLFIRFAVLDVLKITDFGLATIFRHKGVERKLSKRCGTLVYVAPEVFQGEYDAAPADIWSCGVVLVALLTGELPWDSPMPECVAFMDWKERRSLREPPWSKMHNVAICKSFWFHFVVCVCVRNILDVLCSVASMRFALAAGPAGNYRPDQSASMVHERFQQER